MYSGKIAVPPSGGGIRKLVMIESINLLEIGTLNNNKGIWNNNNITR
jgi:hypothetical protein